MTTIPESLRRSVQERARGRCEYCLIHEDFLFAHHQPDHIIAEQHGGPTTLDNLAWSCTFCNRHKGSNIASVDPQTGKVVTLFNPRTQQWKRHFRLNGPRIEPLTANGRATVFLLQFNISSRIDDRLDLMSTGDYP
jgi:5-methylcytosine-specific restriction endonuclease McrA